MVTNELREFQGSHSKYQISKKPLPRRLRTCNDRREDKYENQIPTVNTQQFKTIIIALL